MHARTAAVALATLFAAGTAAASDLVNFTTVFNTDWTQAGVGGLRGMGSGEIALSAVRGPVTRAYLYWHGPANPTSDSANAGISFAGNAIVGTSTGLSDDNFWGFDNSQAYRADVTALVSGNGSYALGDMTKPGVEINGASLIVFYDDGNAANNRDVVLFNGNDANWPNPYDADGWNTTLSGINYSGGAVGLHMHVSDGQNFSDDDDGTLLLNGDVLATGGIFQGDSTPRGTGGVANGALWDIRSFDVTSFLSPGSNAMNFSMSTVNDALSLVAVAIDLPSGAAPPIPEPGTYALMLAGLAGLAGLGWATRRRRSGP